jgi:hypothetical protein
VKIREDGHTGWERMGEKANGRAYERRKDGSKDGWMNVRKDNLLQTFLFKLRSLKHYRYLTTFKL